MRTRERDRARSAVDHGTVRRRNAAALVADCSGCERGGCVADTRIPLAPQIEVLTLGQNLDLFYAADSNPRA